MTTGTQLRSGGKPITEHDRREIAAFRRFLALGVRPGEVRRIPREFPGWLLYCLGEFGPRLWPPEGYDEIHPTAWTFPA